MCVSHSYCTSSFILGCTISLPCLYMFVETARDHKIHSREMHDDMSVVEADFNRLLARTRDEVLNNKLELL